MWKHTTVDLGDTKIEGWICGEHFVDTGNPEFIPDRIKEDRKKYAKDMLQPWRQGEPSKEFIEAFPSQAKKTFTATQIKKAKNVWK